MSATFDTPAPPPLPPPARRHWPWVLAIVVLVAAGITALVWRPFPTEEERKYFGWWYGWESTDDRNARAWISELRPDGQAYLQFMHYTRKSPAAAWETSTTEEVGTWRVRDGVRHLATENPARRLSFLEKFQRFQETGHVRREHFYRTLEITERETRYQSVALGTVYRALHSNTPVSFPREPLPPEQWEVEASPATRSSLR